MIGDREGARTREHAKNRAEHRPECQIHSGQVRPSDGQAGLDGKPPDFETLDPGYRKAGRGEAAPDVDRSTVHDVREVAVHPGVNALGRGMLLGCRPKGHRDDSGPAASTERAPDFPQDGWNRVVGEQLEREGHEYRVERSGIEGYRRDGRDEKLDGRGDVRGRDAPLGDRFHAGRDIQARNSPGLTHRQGKRHDGRPGSESDFEDAFAGTRVQERQAKFARAVLVSICERVIERTDPGIERARGVQILR